jgi:putative spermidine/putrescine transport system substrate-binding protein
MSNKHIDRRELLKRGAIGGIGLAGLGTALKTLDVGQALAHGAEAATSGFDPALVTAAKKEGHLNVITLPRNWANYGELMDNFTKMFGIGITDANPFGSSAQEVQAIKSLGHSNRAPDVVDVSTSFAQIGQQENLYAPYKVSTWATIPASAKDPAGVWTGDYWGAQTFASNLNIVKQAPKEWDDLLSPKLRGMVAIDNSPVSAGDAFAAVFAAALANGGSLDNVQPGIDWFVKLKKAGNWNPIDCLPANIAKGSTPVAIQWDYVNIPLIAQYKGNPSVAVHVPSSGVYGGIYCQAISHNAPHPNAAKLWLEYLYSDAGQIGFLKGYAHPVRYNDLAMRNKVPAKILATLPDAAHYTKVKIATLSQIAAAHTVINEQWPKKMGS